MREVLLPWRPAGEGCEGLLVLGTACGGCRRRRLGSVSCFPENAGSARELETWLLLQGQVGLGTFWFAPPQNWGLLCVLLFLRDSWLVAQFLSFFLAHFVFQTLVLYICSSDSSQRLSLFLWGVNLICPCLLLFTLVNALRGRADNRC